MKRKKSSKKSSKKSTAKRCRYCPDPAHSIRCGKCLSCCDADAWAAAICHPALTASEKQANA